MIVPMKKVCLVVEEKDEDSVLVKLRDIGVIHIVKTEATSERLADALDRKTKAEDAIGLIHPYKAPKKKKKVEQRGGRERRAPLAIGERRGRRATDKMGIEELEPYSLDAVNAPSRPDLVDYMMGQHKIYKELEDRQALLARERGRVSHWGEFDPNGIKELVSLGLPVFLYDITPEALRTIPAEIRYVIFNQDKAGVRLMSVYQEIPGFTQFKLPEKSLAGIETELEEIQDKLDEMNARFKSFADRRPTLKKEMTAIQNNVDFEAARTEFVQTEGKTTSSGAQSGLGLCLLKGYVPTEDMANLKTAAAANCWALVADDPDKEDYSVPTKLKNSRFTRLFYPIASFLDVTPGYRETDVSIFFLLFFSLFYAMIFGDAGYGTLVTLAVIFGIFKTIKTGVPAVLKLFLMLGLCNIAWGVATCSYFGISLEHIPQSLKNISLSYISEAKTDGTTVTRNLQIFCFTLGLVHLTLAHFKRISTNLRTLRVFGDLGSLGILWGIYNVVLILVVKIPPIFPLNVVISLIGGGFALYFVFNSYEGSVAKSVLASCQNFIGVVLSITSAFADIMSYIRLWAVGLAGAAIASTINSMAGPMLGGFMVFGATILLLGGHGINFVLGAMGVLVHGVRLNTLEFSSHVGLTWSGVRYKPFALKQ